MIFPKTSFDAQSSAYELFARCIYTQVKCIRSSIIKYRTRINGDGEDYKPTSAAKFADCGLRHFSHDTSVPIIYNDILPAKTYSSVIAEVLGSKH